MDVVNIHSFIHSAISIAPLQVLYYSEALPTTARILYRRFTPKRKATVGKGLAQGPYMAARAGVEPTTLRLKAIDSTKAPPCPTYVFNAYNLYRHNFLNCEFAVRLSLRRDGNVFISFSSFNFCFSFG